MITSENNVNTTQLYWSESDQDLQTQKTNDYSVCGVLWSVWSTNDDQTLKIWLILSFVISLIISLVISSSICFSTFEMEMKAEVNWLDLDQFGTEYNKLQAFQVQLVRSFST